MNEAGWAGWISTTTAGAAVLGIGLAAMPRVAQAHIDIVLPESRYGPDMIKDAPCGHPDNPPGENEPHVYQTGETITIVVDEFVAHEGHLRVAFAENDEDIVTISGFDDFNNFPGVLMDNIEDPPGMKQFTLQVPMPDQECDNCTLQVIQVMYDGDGFQEDDLYYSCIDITLLDEVPSADDGGSDDMGDGMDDAADGMDDAADGMADGADDMGGDTGGTEGGDGTDGGADGSGDEGGCAIGTRPGPVALLGFALFGLVARRRRVVRR